MPSSKPMTSPMLTSTKTGRATGTEGRAAGVTSVACWVEAVAAARFAALVDDSWASPALR
jgi:hypothetical protein